MTLINDQTVKIHPSSTLAGKKFDAIVYDELVSFLVQLLTYIMSRGDQR